MRALEAEMKVHVDGAEDKRKAEARSTRKEFEGLLKRAEAE